MRTRFLALLVILSLGSKARADTITHFGDFADSFGSIGETYDSSIPDVPDDFEHKVHMPVVGMEKFDPTLGTLTDITIFSLPPKPIEYTLAGGMTVTEIDSAFPFGATASLLGVIELNYSSTSSVMVLGDMIPLVAAGTAAAGTGSFAVPITTTADGKLTGSESVFGSVDLSDFVGPPGEFVDKLFVDLFVEKTAAFTTDNATATIAAPGTLPPSLFFDVFGGDSSGADTVVGVTYTFTAVPEPTTFGLFAIGTLLLTTRRRRKHR